MKKRMFSMLLAVALLTGCSTQRQNTQDMAARYAYGQLLWNIVQLGTLPDGKELYDGNFGSFTDADSCFAVTDVDNDGAQELVLLWKDAAVSDMVCYVWGYEEKLCTELKVFPSVTFYDNGTVKAGRSHNQGYAGDFFPYYVYRYDKEQDAYVKCGGVDAWSKSIHEENFPMDIDADGDGMVYYLLPAEWDGQYRSEYLTDGAEYESWCDSYFNDANEVKLTFEKLTDENIEALGCPKPEVENAEPAG